MKFYLILFQFIFIVTVSGQNLVPNPSFEFITACPDNFYQIYKASPWFSPDCGTTYPDHGYAVLFNGCNYSFAGVPDNVMCRQFAHTGTSYAGIEVLSILGRNNWTYRQYLETELTKTLEKDKKYYFEMYFNLCDRHPGLPLCFNADSLGVVFSTNKIDKNDHCQLLPLKPDVHAMLPPIVPGSEWHKVDGCFTAKGGEKFITIGNYAGEATTNCGLIDTLAHFIYVDDIMVIAEVDIKFDTVLCPNTSWEMDALNLRKEYQTMDGWSYQWSDGETSIKRRFSANTNVKLTVSRKGCFNDVYEFNVKVDPDCTCRALAPNAFTPNGDGLNDLFLPQIRCGMVQMFNYSLTIYNRWGEKVFSTNDKSKGWDGKFKSSVQGTEVYSWIIQYDMKDGSGNEHKNFSGTVTAIR